MQRAIIHILSGGVLRTLFGLWFFEGNLSQTSADSTATMADTTSLRTDITQR